MQTGYQTERDPVPVGVTWNCAPLWKGTWTSPQQENSYLFSSVRKSKHPPSPVKTCRSVQKKVGPWPYFHQGAGAFKDMIMSDLDTKCWRRGCFCCLGRDQAKLLCFLCSVNKEELDPGCSLMDVTWLIQHILLEESSSFPNLGEFWKAKWSINSGCLYLIHKIWILRCLSKPIGLWFSEAWSWLLPTWE